MDVKDPGTVVAEQADDTNSLPGDDNNSLHGSDKNSLPGSKENLNSSSGTWNKHSLENL